MGVQFYNGLSNYNTLRADYLRSNIEDIKLNENVKPETVEEPKENESLVSSSLAIDRRSKVANLEDISLTFNKEDDFGLIGSEAPIKSLDMEKAISEMKMDTILQEYQFFVGNQKPILSNEDGVVIPK